MKRKQPDMECECGGFLEEKGLDKETHIPQYECNSCGKICYNESDL